MLRLPYRPVTSRTGHSNLQYVMVALVQFIGIAQSNQTFVSPGSSAVVVIPPHGQVSLTVDNISAVFSYATFEAHTQWENVSISSLEAFERDVTLEGSHVGVVNLLQQNDTQSTVYVKSNVNTSVNVLVYAQLYTPSDPVPGACNQIFKLENDPNIHLTYYDHWTFVDFQWSNVGFKRQGAQRNCEVQKYQKRLTYDLYVYFLSDQMEATFLADVPKMLGADAIMKNGRKVLTVSNTGTLKSLGRLSSDKGLGVVYAIVVKDTLNGTVSSYIPAQTYSCQPGDSDCSRTYKALDIIIAIVSGIIGLFLCFLGHRYLKTEFFVFGFIGFLLVFYIVLQKETGLSAEASFGIGVVLGIVGGSFFLLFWYYCGIPVVSVLLVGLTAGYLVSSVLFYTPFGNLSYWDSTLTYGLTFTCGLLIAPVFLLCFTRTLNILACTFVGSYLCMICVDIFLRSSLKYIILASVYRQTVPNYQKVTILFPYEKNEIILTIIWGVLFIFGSAFQFVRERKKAPFPACPAHVKRARRLERPLSRPHDNERAPLLGERSRPQYSRGQGHSRTNLNRQREDASAPPVEHNEPT